MLIIVMIFIASINMVVHVIFESESYKGENPEIEALRSDQ